MDVEIREEKKGKATVFLLSGRLDSTPSPMVEEKILNSISNGAAHFIEDFSPLSFN